MKTLEFRAWICCLRFLLGAVCVLSSSFHGFSREFPIGSATAVVTTEEGRPLPGAKVNYAFVVPKGHYNVQVENISTFTNDRGHAYAQGRCDSVLTFGASMDGFYRSGGAVSFERRSGGRWQPWNKHVTLVMRKKLNPIAMYARAGQIISLPVLDERVGFDLEVGDWVAPYGKGANPDIMFKGKRRYIDLWNFDATVEISFARPNDGIQEVPVLRGSDLKVAHRAPEEGYQPTLVKWRKADLKRGYQSNIVTEDGPCFVFRTRTTADAAGKITSANYGKIYGDIQVFIRTTPTLKVQVSYYFNPNVHDRNLEFDKRRNLATDSPFPVRDP